ncbi:phage protease [Frateuria sp. YIM B11624]|uniref:phage protease n=1 Tax=Frateuria sp. YIM B11624 TaxID=3143185 RepID=UPI003C72A22E
MLATQHPLSTALCAALDVAERAALCFALGDVDAADLAAPQWRELIPAPNANGLVQGRDGRWWRMPNAQAVVDQFDLDLAVDINHASELKAPKGEEAPAQGWVDALEARNGAVWGRIAWNDDGRQVVAGRKYRFLSPVFKFDPDTRQIFRLTSVALVNDPNFPLALNRAADQENPPVDEAIRKALGLPETATPAEAVTAINALQTKAASNVTPSLDKYVPRGDYDTAINRAQTAENKLAEQAKAQLQASIDAEVDAALKAGKITPATVDYHKAQCATEGGLERFRAFVQVAPAVAGDSNLDGKNPAGGDGKALNATAKSINAMFGNSAEDIAKYGKENA